jgi:hypothetical protein
MRSSRKTPRFGIIFAWVAGVLAMLGGAAATYTGINRITLCRELAAGPTADATITRSEVVTRRGSKGRKYHRVVVEYTYQVNGPRYSGNSPLLQPYESQNLSRAARVAAAFPLGATVPVHYLPHNPGRSVLDPRLTRQVVEPILGGALGCSVGLTILLFPRATPRYPEPDLPVHTTRTPTGFAIAPSFGWRTSGLIGSIVATALTGVAALISLPDWPTPPSLQSVAAFSVGMIAIPGIILMVVGSMAHEHSGAILLDLAGGTFSISRLRRDAPPRCVIPLEKILDARAVFRSSKHARDAAKPGAKFDLEILHIDDAGVTRTRRIGTHLFPRDDARELLAWLRQQLALDLNADSRS